MMPGVNVAPDVARRMANASDQGAKAASGSTSFRRYDQPAPGINLALRNRGAGSKFTGEIGLTQSGQTYPPATSGGSK